MLVDLKDGRCRSCDSQLEIVGVDDISMEVRCTECDEIYSVETDAFGDGCMTYYVGFMAGQMEGGDDDDA